MKQAVKRKTLTGDWEAFTFPAKGRQFLVKNFSDAAALVTFLNDGKDDEAIKIAAGNNETVAISFVTLERRDQMVDTIYVKGTGEIEVQSLDTCVTINEAEIDDGVLILPEQGTVENGAVEIPNSEIVGDTLEI